MLRNIKNSINFWRSTNSIGRVLMMLCLGIAVGLFYKTNPEAAKSFLFFSYGDYNQISILFIRLLKMIAMPLIFFLMLDVSISTGLSGSAKSDSKNSLNFFIYFASISVFCIAISIFFFKLFNIGCNYNITLDHNSPNLIIKESGFRFNEIINQIIPNNIFLSLINNNFLHIILISFLSGFVIAKHKKAEEFLVYVRIFLKNIMIIINGVMFLCPFAIFGIVINFINSYSGKQLASLGLVVLLIYFINFFFLYICIPVALKFHGLNPLPFLKKIIPVQLISMTTASSIASLPYNLEAAKKMGISEKQSNFTIPLGAAVNMVGEIIKIITLTLFIAKMYGIDLGIDQIAILCFCAMFAAIGTAPIAGGALAVFAGILSNVGLPVDGLFVLLMIDFILDPISTQANVICDIAIAVMIDAKNGAIDKTLYNS